MNDVLRAHFGEMVSEEDLTRESDVLDLPLRTREELAYFRMFTDALPGVNAQRNVVRFVEANSFPEDIPIGQSCPGQSALPHRLKRGR